MNVNHIRAIDFKKYFKSVYGKNLNGQFNLRCSLHNRMIILQRRKYLKTDSGYRFKDSIVTRKLFHYDDYIDWLRKEKIKKILAYG